METNKKIDWSQVCIIAHLKEGDKFHFIQHRQTHIKGREWTYIKRNGLKCFYVDENGKEHDCSWKRDVIVTKRS